MEDFFAKAQRVATAAAVAAANYLVEVFPNQHQVIYRTPHDLVSEADGEAHRRILSVLAPAFPEHAIFSEEQRLNLAEVEAESLWIIDPLDGTTNYTRGIPHFGISIALVQQGVLMLGVVYHPLRQELFTAVRGRGAYRNGERFALTPSVHEGEKAVVVLNRGASTAEKRRAGAILHGLTGHVRSIRIMGATAVDLCDVACGRWDAMINAGAQAHDYAAGMLIALEAGACASDFQGVCLGAALPPAGPGGWQTTDLLVTLSADVHQLLRTMLKTM